ncbi:cupin domain-containing protein [Sphaerisporangium corydalis]|uniref:Cupin domain-containing protein n=1 Tax=Sphaerisporangium corydalis TaxID=1441875 RepID=A0ABV9EC78_9ACTN|nr:cupin domain-containing protein [Sphaerisporangium corydalis]
MRWHRRPSGSAGHGGPERALAAPVADGVTLRPSEGPRLALGPMTVTYKVTGGRSAVASTFEVVVPPGWDVGAHVHDHGEEIFYVLEGELDLLAFAPAAPRSGDWQSWTSRSGETVVRGGPGSLAFVPPGCPHAFSNPGTRPARMLFQAAPAGHEHYFEELAEILAEVPPDDRAIEALRFRHGITQLTPLRPDVGQAAHR